MTITVIKAGEIDLTPSGGLKITNWHLDAGGESWSQGELFLALAKWCAENGREKEARMLLRWERERRP